MKFLDLALNDEMYWRVLMSVGFSGPGHCHTRSQADQVSSKYYDTLWFHGQQLLLIKVVARRWLPRRVYFSVSVEFEL